MVRVTLTPQELYSSGLVGYRRNLEAICRNRTARFEERVSGELFGFHILSAMAEYSVARWLNVCWTMHVNKFSAGDVGEVEVRYSQRHDLKIRQRDEGIVVSVTGSPPTFLIAGWIDADEGRRLVQPSAPRVDAPPAYFVGHELLNDPEVLKMRATVAPLLEVRA